jgi:hypothetical protein
MRKHRVLFKNFGICLFLLLCSFFICSISVSQNKGRAPLTKIDSKFDIAAGMGIKAITCMDVTDYLNSFPVVDKENNFSTAAEFFISPELEISEGLGIKLEYSYLIKSFDKLISSGKLALSYEIHSPTIMAQYLIKGEGYFLKFGGGLGYYFGILNQKYTYINDNYYSNGIGFKINADGHTTLGGNLFAIISVNIHGGFLGELKSKNDMPIDSRKKVTLGFLGAGLNFGLAYYL